MRKKWVFIFIEIKVTMIKEEISGNNINMNFNIFLSIISIKKIA